MNADRWTKIETLVEQALELPPEEQAAFIQKECGADEKLKKEITSLLQYKEQAFSFIRDFSENIVQPSLAKLSEETNGDDQRINTVVGHYQITDILGAGGMGVVYEARDTHLDRTVALKFLPSHLTQSNKDKQRFIREAKAAAALNHPNICTIHSVEEYEGQHFISMEYIDGQTLREKLESEDITPETALEYSIRIAGALAEAHEKGIVHRDIKPGNIMVDSKGRIKVMDFGLAKLVDSKPITQTGTTLGTMTYMAPEQIQGRSIDHRADLFSFGVLLFEMLTGQRPFGGQYDAAISYAIVHEDPPLLSDLLPTISQKLSILITRLLEKDPAKRYSSTENLAGELKTYLDELTDSMEASQQTIQSTTATETESENSSGSESTSITINFPPLRSRNGMLSLGAVVIVLVLIGYWLMPFFGTQPPPDNSIAVLPLENMSTDPADTNLVDGVHVELINRLAGIGDLTVIARSSVLTYPAENRNLSQIGEELGVSSLIEGTVQRAGDRLRVSVQLVNANNQSTIWSGSFEERMDDVFELQSRIARQVANELHASLTVEEKERLEERPTDNPQAYRFYMQAQEYLSRHVSEEENLRAAEQLLNRAISEDPGFAQAWAMLTVTHSWLYWFHDRTPDQLAKLIETSERAQILDPDLPETQLAVGLYHYWTETDHKQTLSHFESALQQSPNHPKLHQMAAYTHRRLGNWEMLIYHLKKALELDPISGPYTEIAYDYWLLRDYTKAEDYLDRFRELTPNDRAPYFFSALLGLLIDGTLENFEIWWDHIHPRDPAIEEPLWWGYYNTLKYNWDEALRSYSNIEDQIILGFDETLYLPKKYLIASTLEAQGDSTKAFDIYEQLRNQLENMRNKNPEKPHYRVALGKVYARLQECEMAVQEGEKATELLPISQDAYVGTIVKRDLAYIYTLCGQKEQAIDVLESLLSIPSVIHRNKLRIHPDWDPLRDHPRFQELIAGEDKPFIQGL